MIPSEYADTLRLIAKQGPAVLYDGELGSVAVEHIQQTGGIITQQDLLDYQTVSADVIRGNYRGYDLVAPPPPTAGGAHVVEMLNILEAFNLSAMGFGSVYSVHLLAEVLKIGFEEDLKQLKHQQENHHTKLLFPYEYLQNHLFSA